MLRLLDITLATPAENLALDEALLAECERRAEAGEPVLETLRVWESPDYFVALGVSGRLQADVDAAACARDGVPILRRASGGGTVLQGPGCLNYALVLSLDLRPELRDVTRSYTAILQRVAVSLGRVRASQQGTSDLAAGGLKFSGNAQKRSRRTLLHHGTMLCGFEIPRIARYLREPEKQPEYRGHRLHAEFLRNLDLTAAELKLRLAVAWDARPEPSPLPLPALTSLLAEKYLSWEWTERF